MTVGQTIKHYRKMKDMTQEELTQAMGYKTRSSIAKIEKDVSCPPLDQLRKMAVILEVDVTDLLGTTERQKPSFQKMRFQIVEHRCMQVCRLRSYCIKHDYFTCGTNEEYEAMFDLIREGRGHGMTTETLYQVAKAIYDHSDWTHWDDVDVTDIMAGLAREVVDYHFEYEEVTP